MFSAITIKLALVSMKISAFTSNEVLSPKLSRYAYTTELPGQAMLREMHCAASQVGSSDATFA